MKLCGEDLGEPLDGSIDALLSEAGVELCGKGEAGGRTSSEPCALRVRPGGKQLQISINNASIEPLYQKKVEIAKRFIETMLTFFAPWDRGLRRAMSAWETGTPSTTRKFSSVD